MNQKLSQLMRSHFALVFICFLCFVAATAFFSVGLAVIGAIVVAVLWVFVNRDQRRRHKAIRAYVESMTDNMEEAAQDTMLHSPLAMLMFRPKSDEVIWSNDRFSQLIDNPESLIESRLSETVPNFSTRWLLEGKRECPEEVLVGGRRLKVFGSLVRGSEKTASGGIATTYWVDVTDFSKLKDEYFATRPVVAILMLDNYDDLMKNLQTETERSAMRSRLDEKLAAWAAPAKGLLCRYDRDKYLFIFEEQALPPFLESKFSILDAVRSVEVKSAGIPATVSIGMGKDAESFEELYQYANLALEMALSRGGDQVVIKNRFNFEFYGGRTKEMEKRTKVKSRVMANALSELVADASQVFVMGHRFPDMDCIGAAAGVCAIGRKRGVPAHIIKTDPGASWAVMAERLAALPEYEGCFVSAQEAMLAADSKCLLVVVDTNRPEQVMSEELLLSCNKVAVIDHHRRAATYIADAALNYHEPYASSASELVTELLQYIIEPADLLRTEAEALLAGIVLDTKNFTMRTGARTFEAAAFLRHSGADTAGVRKLFQNDLAGTIARYDIIRNARMYKAGIAIAKVDHPVNRITAAQATDELLNISGIEASFTLSQESEDSGVVYISARSMGDINVQVILERLGGGGNGATAGAQVKSDSMSEVYQKLIQSIDQYLADE